MERGACASVWVSDQEPHGEHDLLGDDTIRILDSGPSGPTVETFGLSVESSGLEGLSVVRKRSQ